MSFKPRHGFSEVSDGHTDILPKPSKDVLEPFFAEEIARGVKKAGAQQRPHGGHEDCPHVGKTARRDIESREQQDHFGRKRRNHRLQRNEQTSPYQTNLFDNGDSEFHHSPRLLVQWRKAQNVTTDVALVTCFRNLATVRGVSSQLPAISKT